MVSFTTGAAVPLDVLPDLGPGAAFFLDFDGTLAPIAALPDDVALVPGALDVLARLARMTAGAVALVSGRSIADLDNLVAPLRLAAAGQHGAERRDAAGGLHRSAAVDGDLFAAFADQLAAELGTVPGLLIERKPFGVAVHYRLAPEAEPIARAAVESLLAQAGEGVTMQPGKMVFELKADGISKGGAIASFMAEAPFKGRCPIVAGDDLTDESAFDAVNRLGGVSIKIGAGPTRARHRARDEHSFVSWLARTAEAAS